MTARLVIARFACAATLLVACASAPPKRVEEVPIESAPPTPAAAPEPEPEPAAPTPAGARMPVPPVTSNGTGHVSREQCGRLFDKYIELAVGGDARLSGLGPELKGIIDQAKSQARAEQGDPCESSPPTRVQYDCAMNAKSTDAWQACLK